MYKKSSSVFTIVSKSFTEYLFRLPQYLKYILYPLFGQLIGITVCFLPFLISGQNVNLGMAFICLILGLILFCHSFWQYALISGGLILISKQIVENEPLKEFKYYTEIFKKRTKDYIVFLLISAIIIPILFIVLIIALFTALGLSPQMFASGDFASPSSIQAIALIGLITFAFALLFTVTLQSFVLSPNLTPTESILKAIKLALKNYFPNLGIVILLSIIVQIWSFITGQLSNALIFTQDFYMNHMSAMQMINLIKGYFSATMGGLLLPFSMLCLTWWYLRMDKKETAKNLYK
jgi:hypothetical protein